jgi:hypothetical protein
LKSMSRFRNTKPGGGEPAPTLKNTKVTLSNPSQKEEITMKRSMIFAATLFCSGLAAIGPVHAADAPSTQLQIDVPVSMKASKVVFNMDHPTFAGDQSIGLMYMRLMKMNYASAKVPVDIIAVYRGGSVCLHSDWQWISGSSAGCFLDMLIWRVMQGGRSPTGVTRHIGCQIHAASFTGRLSKYA